MLELKTKLLDEQVYVVWFCLTKDSVNRYIEDYEEESQTRLIEMDEEDELLALEDFEEDIFRSELEKHNISYVGPLKYKYLSKLNYDSPLIGVCRFIKGSDCFDVPYPAEVSNSAKDTIKEMENYSDDSFDRELLKQGLYYEKASNVVLDNGKIDYELRYVSSGQVIEVIKNQHFDLFEDDDLDKNKLIGAHIGDFVIIDEGTIEIGVLIQNITNRYLYSDSSYDKDLINPILKKFSLSSFNELKEKYKIELQKTLTRDAYFKDLMHQMVENVEYEASDEVIKFFDEYPPYAFRDEYDGCEDDDQKRYIIKIILLYHYLLDNKVSDSDIFASDLLSYSLLMFHLNGMVTVREAGYENGKISILDNMKENNVKGITKEYK